MAGNLFAVSIIALVVGTVVVLRYLGKRPTLVSIIVAALMMYIMLFVVLRQADSRERGFAMAPAWISIACFGVLAATVQRPMYRYIVLVTFFAAGVALARRERELVQQPGYTASRTWLKGQQNRARWEFEEARRLIASLAINSPTMTLSEGWVEDVCLDDQGKEVFSSAPSIPSATVENYWHTWFTGIYRLQEGTMGIWCPGGLVNDCVNHLELRQRK